MYQYRQPLVPGRTGYRIAYRMHETNHCPGCGKSQWVVGRMTAECSFCHTALPINEGGMSGVGLIRAAKPRDIDLEPIAA